MLMRLSILISTLFSVILISGCVSPESSSSADWSSRFVVWNDDLYEITDDVIEPNKIDKEIGEVKHYSDSEGNYKNGFSNKYPVGTKLFAIKDIETSEHIAVQTEDGIFIKAIDKGRYGGRD